MRLISQVVPGSPAGEARIRPGDSLVSINGESPRDVIDYQLMTACERLEVTLARGNKTFSVIIDNPDLGGIGLRFERSIFDRLMTCRNRCVFCFVDQLPHGCRKPLLIKDDDFRLSFLYGNFITLTNIGEPDVDRLIEQRLSPLYVSLHSTDPDIRRRLLRPVGEDRALEYMHRLVSAGIEIHVQIVACPGVNDGEALKKTLDELWTGFRNVGSVGIVPVGLTGHRRGLPELRPFTGKESESLLRLVDVWQNRAKVKDRTGWVYAADEFYFSAGEGLPPAQRYDDFPQIENGIGLSRRFIDDALSELDGADPAPGRTGGADVVTGILGAKVIKEVAPIILEKTGIEIRVFEAGNNWLGGHISVAALLSGSDIIGALRSVDTSGPVYFPGNCLNQDRLFLDGMTAADVSQVLGVEAVPAGPDGAGFVRTVLAGGAGDG